MAIYLNDPPLANGYLVSGVANFYTSVKPTVRVDGTALVIGDVWVNPSTGVQGFWNGTYWLDSQVTHISGFSPATVSASTNIIANFGNVTSALDGSRIIQTPFKPKPFGTPYSILFENISWFGMVSAGTIDASNYWDLYWRISSRRMSPVEVSVTIFNVPESVYSGLTIFEATKNNIVFSFTDTNANNATGGGDWIHGYCAKIGSPPNLIYQTLRASFREIL